MKKWMVYFLSEDQCREGNEIILAPDREEAIRLYRHFFNIGREVHCRAIPVIDREFTNAFR